MFTLKLKNFFISLLKLILRIFSFSFILLIILIISSSLLQLFDNYDSYPLIVNIISMETSVTTFVENTFPTTISGIQLSKILIVFISFILKLVSDLFQGMVEEKQTYYAQKINQLKKESLNKNLSHSNPISAFITKLKRIFIYRKSKLNKLQKKLSVIQSKIEELGEELVFLSIEIVDSTKMKKGANPAKVEKNFSKFKEYLQEKIQDNDAEQYIWHSDQLLVYFKKFENAFSACQAAISGLVNFNREVNTLNHDFDIQCGINSGFIYYEDIDTIENIKDISIETAEKLQKAAPPNAVYVTEDSIKPLTLHKNFDPVSKTMAGQEILSWYPKLRLTELQKTLTETKKQIREMAKKLVFLSIDVVESTKMKEGMDSADIEYSFDKYKTYVEEKFRDHDVVKTTWTPDGVMGCFDNFEKAFQTAKEIIEGLPDFNQEHSLPKFRVRCGINTGLIYYDEVRPLEEMSDHSIDVAGHLQKAAEPNTIYVTEKSIEPKELYDVFDGVPKLVDEYSVFVWSPPFLI
ncbi:MAG: adenylate/guanylate cyclase domain-containing protein [Elusimicrobiota bacterium]